MELQIITGRLHDPRFKAQADAFFRLRYRVFHERLQWQVKCGDGVERDMFDDAHTLYLTATDAAGHVSGGWRLRPTTRPYMLADVFPQLLHGRPPPSRRNVWEISRFAIEDQDHESAVGLGLTARALVRQTVNIALEKGISEYVLVVSVAVERLLRMLGLRLNRFGPPLMIGKVRSVACWVAVDAHTMGVAYGGHIGWRVAA